MSLRYFKKLIPATGVMLSNNAKLMFSTNDGLVGYYATDNEGIANEFIGFMHAQRYGLSEISEQEFKTEYLEKKNPLPNSNPVWREEYGKNRSGTPILQQVGPQAVAAAVGVSGTDVPPSRRVGVVMADTGAAPAAVAAMTASSPAAPEPKKEFKPPVGSRKAKQ